MSSGESSKKISEFAGKLVPTELLLDVPKLLACYYTEIPDPSIKKQRVSFGTSGHRGTAFDTTFNEWHILAITQAICLYRTLQKIDGPLFLGFDTHAISIPAFRTAFEVLSANGVNTMISKDDDYTPTPVISHSILTYNKGRTSGLADGIVITPSHNPPHHGGFKYNPPTGGPANIEITSWIENKANEFLENKLKDIKRSVFETALKAATTHRFDYLNHYINDLSNVINMDLIRDSKIHIGVDPFGGAGVHYWEPIAERYKLNLTVMNTLVDPTFRFMTVDWDGQIRTNPASEYAMVKVVEAKDKYDISFACDTDHDRHGIVTRGSGLLSPNHYFSVAIPYLLKNRPLWKKDKMIAKTVVSSHMLDRVTEKSGHKIFEVPVGFKWFVDGLIDGSLGFCGEESAGATFNRLDGSVWTTDKDALVPALLSAEITASTKRDLGDIYKDYEKELGKTFYKREDTEATSEQKEILKNLSAEQIKTQTFANDPIEKILTKAPGNDAPINGVKVITKNGWFVARPSGTENIYEVYAESFKDENHMQLILKEAQTLINTVLSSKGNS